MFDTNLAQIYFKFDKINFWSIKIESWPQLFLEFILDCLYITDNKHLNRLQHPNIIKHLNRMRLMIGGVWKDTRDETMVDFLGTKVMTINELWWDGRWLLVIAVGLLLDQFEIDRWSLWILEGLQKGGNSQMGGNSQTA